MFDMMPTDSAELESWFKKGAVSADDDADMLDDMTL